MKFTLLSTSQAGRQVADLVRSCKWMDAAVAWAGENSVVESMRLNRRKMRRIVFGTHMYRTDPAVLRAFMDLPEARCMSPDGDLFHPKLYIFEMEESFTAIIGSHNLTKAAFDGDNIEASAMIEAPGSSPEISSLRSFIDECWRRAELIDENGFLFAYERQYEANRENRRSLGLFTRLKTPLPSATRESPSVLTWEKFTADVKTDKHHSIEGRLQVLERAKKIFAERGSLDRMLVDERKAVAGIYGRVEPKIDNLEWAWFGTMFGQGDFKSLVIKSPGQLSQALDEIPIEGNVEKTDYERFREIFISAFDGKSHVGGVATASRLLAMKRPDIFVAINKGNRKELCKATGFVSSSLSLGNYWDRIVVATRVGPWWLHPRPNSRLDGRIWDNRAAMLDSIYYVPV